MAFVTVRNHRMVKRKLSQTAAGQSCGMTLSVTPYPRAARQPATWPASFTTAGRLNMSSRIPTTTTIVAPTATPFSSREKLKL